MNGFFMEYMPHGHSYAWQAGILWTTVLSDLTIFIAYSSIPVALLLFIKKRKDLAFKGIFILFAAFILLCGLSHLFSIYTIWHGSYGIQAIVKFATAIVSLLTAIAVYRQINRALAIPSPQDLQRALDKAEKERQLRARLELERTTEAIFKFTTQLVPTGLLVIDENQNICLANQSAEALFGYSNSEFSGMELAKLIPPKIAPRHGTLFRDVINHSHDYKTMASGRVVQGVSKSGELIALEIKIAVHAIEGRWLAFANIISTDTTRQERVDDIENVSRIQRAIRATNEGIWEWDIQEDQVWYSDRLLELIGKAGEQNYSFSDWRDHIHPQDRQTILDAIEAHFSKRERYDIIYRGRTNKGKFEWMHTRGDTLFDEEGKPKLMTGSLTNIHEVQTLKESLIKKTHFLDQVLERSLTGLYVFDLKQQKYTYINPEYTRITGWTLDDIKDFQEAHTSIIPLFHEDDRAAVREHIDNVLSGKLADGVGIEYRFKHKNGPWIWFYSRYSILNTDENNDVTEILGTFFDITEMRIREDNIRELAMNFTSTFEQAAVGMAQVSLQGKFIKVNEKLCHILGYTHKELQSMTISDITHPDDIKHSDKLQVLLKSGEEKNISIKKRHITKSKNVIWTQVTAAMVKLSDDTPHHFVSVIEDITERVKIEDDLAASNASLERFAFSASHDLQEPLRKISAFSGLLEERLKGKLEDSESIFQLNRISDAAKRMGDMIHGLLTLSRAAHNKVIKEYFSFSEILEQVIDDLSPKIMETGADIYLNQDGKVHVERNSFEQVIRNVVLNSIQYTKPNTQPKINIFLSTIAETVTILISDKGIGINTLDCERIFEPFKQIQPKIHKGAGMGLAICRQVIISHGGEIRALPSDNGATIQITLPKLKKHDQY